MLEINDNMSLESRNYHVSNQSENLQIIDKKKFSFAIMYFLIIFRIPSQQTNVT